MRLLGHRLGRIIKEVGVGAFTAASDSPSQLVQLTETETIGMIDDQRVCVGDIKTSLDNRGTYQHIDVTMPEVTDHAIELLLPHLAVRNADMRFRHEFMNLRRDGRNVLHTIVHVEDLATT